MSSGDVNLSVLVPKGLRVIAREVEVHGIGPRLGVVRILGFENDLR